MSRSNIFLDLSQIIEEKGFLVFIIHQVQWILEIMPDFAWRDRGGHINFAPLSRIHFVNKVQ
jgi:hypothetical protein